jgi:septum site-determining protein MinC
VSDAIAIKGIKDGLLVTVNGGGAWAETAPALMTRIDQSADFFRGAKLSLDVGPRAINAADLGQLRDTLSERNVSLVAVLSESVATTRAAQALGLKIALATAPPPSVQARIDAEADPEELREDAVLVRRTMRSGRSVRHAGNVVVLGDVNPGAEIMASGDVIVWGRLRGVVHAGAEIIASGDVIVWGRLRGVVHAGAEGDTSAVVCALDLAPTQLRIAGHIAVSPPQKGQPIPEMARVKDGQIVAERWKARDR